MSEDKASHKRKTREVPLQFLYVEEAARFLRIGKTKFYELIKHDDSLPYIQMGSSRLYDINDLRDFVNRKKITQ